MSKKKAFKNYTTKDKILLIFLYILLTLFVVSIIVPIIYIFIASFMNPEKLNNSGLSLNPSDWSLNGYKRVFEDEFIIKGYINSIIYSFSFSIITTMVSILAAYPMSKKEFLFIKFFNIMFLITMFFGGGLIPTYLLIDNLGMLNTIWAILLPGAVNVWNIILARTYFRNLPKDLREASALDGASEFYHFFKIVFPLSKPIIAVLILYAFVGMWNSYFDAMIYLDDANKQPLQLVLRSILIQNQPRPGMIADIQSTAEMSQIAELLKYSTIVISSLPLLIMYPFFQKYFDNGIMVGSLKG